MVGAMLGVLVVPLMLSIGKLLLLRYMPARRLWKLFDPATCMIVVSCTPRYMKGRFADAKKTSVDPVCRAETPAAEGEPRCDESSAVNGNAVGSDAMSRKGHSRQDEWYQYRYDTGEGQMKALPYLISSLHDAYGSKMNWSNIRFSEDLLHESIDMKGSRDIILLGGPLTNKYTAAALKQLEPLVVLNPFGDDGGLGVQMPRSGRKTVYAVHHEYEEPGRIPGKACGRAYATKDYAVIIRRTNAEPSHPNKMYIFAGCTTHGTAMAAQFFCTRADKESRILGMGERDYLAIVSMDLMPGGLSWQQMNLEEVFPLE